jgi:hypothetical protein
MSRRLVVSESVVEQVKDAITPLADKLQHGAEFLYTVFYRQTIIEGILAIVLPIVLLVVGGVALKKWLAFARVQQLEYEKKKAAYADNPWGLGIGLAVAAYLTIVVAGSMYMVNGVMKLANPNFYTIQRVIQSVKAKEPR